MKMIFINEPTENALQEITVPVENVQQKNNICPKCNAPVSHGQNFCSKCGAQVNGNFCSCCGNEVN